MNNIKFHEKLYFHEIEARNNISSRYQIPLAILLSLVSFYGYILVSITNFTIPIILILFFETMALCFAICYFIKSFYGHEYRLLPNSETIENYNKLLVETYKDYDNGDKLAFKYFCEYLNNEYIQSATFNTKANDLRSKYLHKSIVAILYNIPFIMIIFYIFIFNNHSKIKAQDINTTLVNQVMQKYTQEQNRHIVNNYDITINDLNDINRTIVKVLFPIIERAE